MAVEPALCDCPRCVPTDDLAGHLKAAALVAIDDVLPAVLAEPRKVRSVTIELQMVNDREVRSGVAWIERGVSIAKLLGPMPDAPAGQEAPV